LGRRVLHRNESADGEENAKSKKKSTYTNHVLEFFRGGGVSPQVFR
jgi:hypothetical protein